jgi:hypothetical protein
MIPDDDRDDDTPLPLDEIRRRIKRMIADAVIPVGPGRKADVRTRRVVPDIKSDPKFSAVLAELEAKRVAREAERARPEASQPIEVPILAGGAL